MIIIKNKASPEDVEELKRSICEKAEIIKESTDDEETLEKIDDLTSFLDDNSNTRNRKKIRKYKKINKKLSFYQRFKLGLESDIDIDPGRLIGLTDGIFGMVMTLLVFGIALPELQIANYSDFVAFISSLTPTIGLTIVSFVLIASFWIHHHEFIKVKRLNLPFLWINIMFLICISFIPFTTSLIGYYSRFVLSDAIFELNILLAIVFFSLTYQYAYSRGFLEQTPSKEEKRYVIHTLLLLMALTIIVNILDFNVSGSFIYLFLLVPVISTIRDINFKMSL